MPKKEIKSKEMSLETVLWNCRVALRTIGSLEKSVMPLFHCAF